MPTSIDLFYTDPFVFPCIVEQNIRFSSVEEVVAMKFEVIAQGGRKKDFWDIHELLEKYTLNDMIDFYIKRNPYGDTKGIAQSNQIIDFSIAEDDFTPKCFKGKVWELIKLDFEELVKKMKPDLPERKHFGVFVGIGQFSLYADRRKTKGFALWN